MNGRWDEILEHSDEVAEKIGRELLTHPLARRFTDKAISTGNNRIYTPADVLGERLGRLGALLMLAAEAPDDLSMNVAKDPGAKSKAMLRVTHAALNSYPFLWTEDARMAAREALGDDQTGIPQHVISPRILPQPKMWWTWETGIGIAEDITVDANLLVDHGDSFEYMAFGESTRDGTMSSVEGHPKPFVDGVHIEYGKVFPDDYTGPVGVRVKEAIGLLSFLNSPYIPKQTARLSRQERRSVARAGADDFGDEISWIILRRPALRKSDENPDDPARGSWKHQWVVTGHYRAQWYPTEQAHHLIWIAPYLKGPEDAPLLEHSYKVAR